MSLRICALGALAAFASLANAAESIGIDKLPPDVRPFVEKGTIPIYVGQSDLNGDARQDFVLVLERQKAKAADPEIEEEQRPLLILVRQADGSLKEVKRNSKVVYCSTCGGVMGDPFQGVEMGPKTFTVSHYGGSSWRWSVEYKFSYSRKDDTWQLVKVETSNFHSAEPDKAENKTYTPPKAFGKIDISDFDPDNWKNQGPR